MLIVAEKNLGFRTKMKKEAKKPKMILVNKPEQVVKRNVKGKVFSYYKIFLLYNIAQG